MSNSEGYNSCLTAMLLKQSLVAGTLMFIDQCKSSKC